jgi:hypothetical protein
MDGTPRVGVLTPHAQVGFWGYAERRCRLVLSRGGVCCSPSPTPHIYRVR